MKKKERKTGSRHTKKRMDSLFSISPPENFVFSDFPSWPNWLRRFERLRVAAGLDQKGEAYQVNSLVYTMGDKADDILCTLGLSDEDKKIYKPVKEAFDKYLICKHNVIYERCRFNKRSLEPGESAGLFISAVYNWQNTAIMVKCRKKLSETG